MRALLAATTLLIAGNAGASVQLSARPVFELVHQLDPVALRVEVASDVDEGEVTIVAASAAELGTHRTVVTLPLPAGSRKTVTLIRPGFPGGISEVTMRSGKRILAQAAARVRRVPGPTTLVGCLGTLPTGVPSREGDSSTAPTFASTPVRGDWLPEAIEAWPSFDALLWPQPRSTDLTPAGADALRRWVFAGGHLVVSVSHEEPGALAALGLADVLPAQLSRDASGGVVVGAERPDARVDRSLLSLLRTRIGWGTVTLLPVPGAAADASSASLWRLALIAPGLLLPAEFPNPENLSSFSSLVGENAPPAVPFRSSLAILLGFAMAALPLDFLLTHRALKRGQPPRVPGLRYGLIVLAATTLGFGVTEHASRVAGSTRRLDVIDVDLDSGAARGRVLASFFRAAPGSVSITDELVTWRQTADAEPWRDRSLSHVELHQSARSDSRLHSVTMDLSSWQTAIVDGLYTPARESIPVVARLSETRFRVPPCRAVLVLRAHGMRVPAQWSPRGGELDLAGPWDDSSSMLASTDWRLVVQAQSEELRKGDPSRDWLILLVDGKTAVTPAPRGLPPLSDHVVLYRMRLPLLPPRGTSP